MKKPTIPSQTRKSTTSTPKLNLSDLPPGITAKILSLTTPNRQLQRKLMNLGFIPGNEIRVIQRKPAYLIEVGFTQIALDRETCQLIQVVKGSEAELRRR